MTHITFSGPEPKERAFKAWAVRVHYRHSKPPEQPFLAGVLYWGGEPEARCSGVRTAVFSTRAQARHAAARARTPGTCTANAVRVRVIVQEAP